MRDYQNAPKDAVAMTVVTQPTGWVRVSADSPAARPNQSVVGSIEMEYLVAEITGGCDDDVVPIRLHYDADERFVDFSETLAVVTAPSASAPVRVYMPVYFDPTGVNGRGTFEFSHLEMRAEQASCLVRLWRIRDASHLPLSLFVTLRPGWAAERSYQSFGAAGNAVRMWVPEIVFRSNPNCGASYSETSDRGQSPGG